VREQKRIEFSDGTVTLSRWRGEENVSARHERYGTFLELKRASRSDKCKFKSYGNYMPIEVDLRLVIDAMFDPAGYEDDLDASPLPRSRDR